MLLVVPLIPILLWVGAAAVVGGMVWYYNLSNQEKNRANEIAVQIFGQVVEDLSRAQADRIKTELEWENQRTEELSAQGFRKYPNQLNAAEKQQVRAQIEAERNQRYS